MMKILSGFVFAAISSLLVTPVIAQETPVTPQTDWFLLAYTSPLDDVSLPDGRTIHMVCMGEGSPTIVLTAGNGGWSDAWSKVQPAIADHTRVCTWDRAGLGFSSGSPLPQTSNNTTDDLEAALDAAEITGPIIAVGHSMGGYESLMLADRRPKQVVGMVLVDSSIPDQMARIARVSPAIMEILAGNGQPPFSFITQCAAQIRAGEIAPSSPGDSACFAGRPWPAHYPPQLREALDGQLRGGDLEEIALVMETFASSMSSFGTNQIQVINPERDFGDMPMIVLSRDALNSPPDASAQIVVEAPARLADWQDGHTEYAALSTRGERRILPSTTHMMQIEKPEVVIGPILEVLETVRRDALKETAE